jgi:Flp pilus assembly pilin Flp
MSGLLERLIQFVIAVAIISVFWWILTHPAMAASVIVTIVGGVTGFVSAIFSGISGLLN